MGRRLGPTALLLVFVALWTGLVLLASALGAPAPPLFAGAAGRLAARVAALLPGAADVPRGAEVAPAIPSAQLGLVLPPAVYAVEGRTGSLYFSNLVLLEDPESVRYAVECGCPFLRMERRRAVLAPGTGDAGSYELVVRVAGWDGAPLAEARTRLVVAPARAGEGESLRLLLVGDSVTHQNMFPNTLARLLSEPGNPAWSMIGTHSPPATTPWIAPPLPGVAHEGYGGWKWEYFLDLWAPGEEKIYYRDRSPFVFARDDGTHGLDVPRYLREAGEGRPPGAVIFFLGVNDAWTAEPAEPEAMDRAIDAVLANAERLLAAFRAAAPGADLGVVLPPPFTDSEHTFRFVYGGQWPAWRQRRVQHRLVERMIGQLAGREAERLWLLPGYLHLDTIDGYPIDNAGHPTQAGSDQLAVAFYAWLKQRMAEPAP